MKKLLNKEKLEQNIEKIANYDFKNNKIFGSAYWVYQKGNVVYQKCFGTTSPGKESVVSENTIFRLASMTKPITAVATLILVERDILSLSDPIAKFIPEFAQIHVVDYSEEGLSKDMGPIQNPITVRQLLAHTSGIGPNGIKSEMVTSKDKQTIDATVDFVLRTGLDYEPDSREAYSGYAAFDVLTKIIEIVTGMDYLSFLKKEIFDPCEMNDTTFIPTEEQWNRMISMHNRMDGINVMGETYKDCVFCDIPCTHYLGGAGLISTLDDYSKFAKMLLNKGKTDTKQIVSEETLQLMSSPQVSEQIVPGHTRWGLGVRVIVDEHPTLPVGSFGWSGAWGSHFWIDPENEIAAVFMKNSLVDGGAGNESAILFEKSVYDACGVRHVFPDTRL